MKKTNRLDNLFVASVKFLGFRLGKRTSCSWETYVSDKGNLCFGEGKPKKGTSVSEKEALCF